MNNKIKIVHGYIQVSTEDQAKNGASLKVQEDAIMEYAKKEFPGSPVVIYRDEGVSGATAIEKRPGLRFLTLLPPKIGRLLSIHFLGVLTAITQPLRHRRDSWRLARP